MSDLDAEGYLVKHDIYDAGVRMKPAAPGVVYRNPENVYAPDPLRGDYTGRVQPRIHYRRGKYNVFGEYVPNGRGGS